MKTPSFAHSCDPLSLVRTDPLDTPQSDSQFTRPDASAQPLHPSARRSPREGQASRVGTQDLSGLVNQLDARRLDSLLSLADELESLHVALAGRTAPAEQIQPRLGSIAASLDRHLREPYGVGWRAELALNETFLAMLSAWVANDRTGAAAALAAGLLSSPRDGRAAPARTAPGYFSSVLDNPSLLPSSRRLVDTIGCHGSPQARARIDEVATRLETMEKSPRIVGEIRRLMQPRSIDARLQRARNDLLLEGQSVIRASDKLKRQASEAAAAWNGKWIDFAAESEIVADAIDTNRNSRGRIDERLAVRDAEERLRRKFGATLPPDTRSRISRGVHDVAVLASLDASIRTQEQRQERAARATTRARAAETDARMARTSAASEALYRQGQASSTQIARTFWNKLLGSKNGTPKDAPETGARPARTPWYEL